VRRRSRKQIRNGQNRNDGANGKKTADDADSADANGKDESGTLELRKGEGTARRGTAKTPRTLRGEKGGERERRGFRDGNNGFNPSAGSGQASNTRHSTFNIQVWAERAAGAASSVMRET